MALNRRTSILRSTTATDISEILDNAQDPLSMMLSSKHSISNTEKTKKSSDITDGQDINNDNNLEMENSAHHDHGIDITNDFNNINSKYYPTNNNNSYFEPFVGGLSPQSLNNDTSSKNEQCMRKILQLTFIISIIFFLSPLIFFIAGASQIIPEYARIAPSVRKHNDNDDTHVHTFWHYPSIAAICHDGTHYCMQFFYFFTYVTVFIIMFISCISLFAIRKDKHPLKSRSCTFIIIFCIALPFYMIWACIGLMYSPSWLGCYPTHTFNNIMYPLLILPYFFRAFRIKKIYDQATTTHSTYNRDMNIFRSARTHSVTANLQYGHDTMTISKSTQFDNHTIQSVHSVHSASGIIKQRSNSLLSAQGDSSFKFDENALSYSTKLDKKLMRRFVLCLIPFIIISITNYFSDDNLLLPTFIKSCGGVHESSAIFIWVVIHAIEIFVLIMIVYWIRLVWRAFSVKQELMIVAVIDMIFCACMIGFNPSKDTVDDGVLIMYIILMRGMGFFMITILLPLYKTYFLISYLPDIPTQDVITSLQAILDDMDACVYFRQFMTEQDAQYLLDFWMEVDLFKDACYNDEIEDIHFAASKIFKKYFDINNHSKPCTSIRYLINSKEKIKGENKKKTFCKAINKIFDEKHKKKVEIHPNIFDHPHRVIFEHMENTQYRLFLRSQFCKQLLATVAGQEEIFRKLINQEIL